MPKDESPILNEVLANLGDPIKQIDKDIKKLAEFFNYEYEESKNFLKDEQDIFLLTRLLSKSNSYLSIIPEESQKKIYSIMKKNRCETNPQLLATMAILKYILNSFLSSTNELKLNKELLLGLEEKALSQYNAFKKRW
jgi:hypothetical protein